MVVEFSDIELLVNFVEIASVDESVEGILNVIVSKFEIRMCTDSEVGSSGSIKRIVVGFGLQIGFEPGVDILDPVGKWWAVRIPHRLPMDSHWDGLSVCSGRRVL